MTKIYLARKEVLGMLGGRRQLEKVESTKLLRRHYVAGLKQERYVAQEVKLVLDRLRVRSS